MPDVMQQRSQAQFTQFAIRKLHAPPLIKCSDYTRGGVQDAQAVLESCMIRARIELVCDPCLMNVP